MQYPHLIEAFGNRIRQLRTERGLSQEQLAELTGFHRTLRSPRSTMPM